MQKFEIRLAEQASDRIAQVGQKLEALGNDVVVRTRTRLEAAAEAAASSFGEVVRGISDQEVDLARPAKPRGAARAIRGIRAVVRANCCKIWKRREIVDGAISSQIGEQLESRIEEGRGALAVEFGIAMDGYRAERDAHELFFQS